MNKEYRVYLLASEPEDYKTSQLNGVMMMRFGNNLVVSNISYLKPMKKMG